MSDTAKTAELDDSGLRCPNCEYNLTGLAEPRCPECGTRFDWDQLRLDQLGRGLPQIAFERTRGWDARRAASWLVTWATVLFTPWIFARQAVKRIHLGHAALFAAVCYVPVAIRGYGFETDFASISAWICTAAVYIVLQAVGFALVDPNTWRDWRGSFLFWLAVGGYTSAIAATECYLSPALLEVDNVLKLAVAPFTDPGFWTSAWFSLQNTDTLVHVLQFVFWIAGLLCCYAARLGHRRLKRVRWLLLFPFLAFGILMLYAFCVEQIGAGFFWSAFGGRINF